MVGIATAERRPNLHYNLIHPDTNVDYGCPDMGWRYEPNTMARLIAEERILWPKSSDGRPRRKVFLNELNSDVTGFSSIIGSEIYTRNGTADIANLFDVRIFDFPKPIDLMKTLVEQGAPDGGIVLDFFAGSASTAHSVLAKNSEDGVQRQMISVQFPEELDTANTNQKTAADFCTSQGFLRSISALSKERIRRAGVNILSGVCHADWNKDIGFRVFKIEDSNMADVLYTPADTTQAGLLDLVDNIKPDRTPEDLLFQVLLDWGVDLTLPIRRKTLHSKTVFFVADNALVACFDSGITDELIKDLAARQPMRVVFRDTAFKDDAAKINSGQIFKSLSPTTDIKAIWVNEN